MAIDRDLWREEWAESDYPSLPCRNCRSPLNYVDDSLDIQISAHNAELVSVTDLDEALARFSVWFQCGHKKCSENVCVSGDVRYEYAYGESGETITNHILRPFYFRPAPPVIEIPDDVSDSIRAILIQSFGLLWADRGACAGCLRSVLELILADWGFPPESKNGGFIPLDGRIRDWKERYGAESVAQGLMAIKWLGNIGIHDAGLSQKRLFDAYEILERLLGQLYPADERHLDSLADEIVRSKGRD